MSNRDDDNEQGPIKVTIFDQPFSLRSPRGAAHVRQVASLLDERMRQVAAHLTIYDIAKVAMLTALNLADELQSVKAHAEQADKREAMQPQLDGAHAAQVKDLASTAPDGETLSWFEAIFDAPVATKQGNERMSSQVAAKLQSLRQAEDGAQNE